MAPTRFDQFCPNHFELTSDSSETWRKWKGNELVETKQALALRRLAEWRGTDRRIEHARILSLVRNCNRQSWILLVPLFICPRSRFLSAFFPTSNTQSRSEYAESRRLPELGVQNFKSGAAKPLRVIHFRFKTSFQRSRLWGPRNEDPQLTILGREIWGPPSI